MSENYETVVSMQHISKRFGGVYALKDVDFDVRKEIHAIVGHNGAGKSTLMKTLMGAYKQDAGEIYLNGKLLNINSPREALQNRIAMVWQELANFPNMTVTENMLMRRFVMKKGGKAVDWKASHALCREYLERMDLDIDPHTRMSQLPLAHQQLVEFAKAMSFDPAVLILDEPTSSLSVAEQEVLYEKIRLIQSKGVAIIFISHKLDEVLMLSDRISVFRDGRKIFTRDAAELSKKDIVTAIVGKETNLVENLHRDGACDGRAHEAVVEIRQLNIDRRLHDISICAGRGEVVGLVGVEGSGISDVGLALMGVEKECTGEFLLEGKKCKFSSPKDAVKAGIGYVPKNRKEEGIIPSMSVGDNIILSSLSDLSHGGMISKKLTKQTVDAVMDEVDLLPRNPQMKMESLSGGNQQKGVIGRWLSRKCKVLILDEPTRGVDVGAIHKIYTLIRSMADAGLSVIVISSEFEETHSVADRLIVLNDGRIVGEMDPKQCSWEDAFALAVK